MIFNIRLLRLKESTTPLLIWLMDVFLIQLDSKILVFLTWNVIDVFSALDIIEEQLFAKLLKCSINILWCLRWGLKKQNNPILFHEPLSLFLQNFSPKYDYSILAFKIQMSANQNEKTILRRMLSCFKHPFF